MRLNNYIIIKMMFSKTKEFAGENMKQKIKRGVSLILCFALTLALSSCSGGTKVTEENVNNTVANVEKALKDFDRLSLKTYVKSSTLETILNLSKSHSQFNALGKAMFEKLEISVKSVDTKNETVTLLVKNRDMAAIATEFTKEITAGRNTVQMMQLLNDDAFLNSSLKKLTAEISEATVPDNPTEITVPIEKNENNLVLVMDEKAEDAISGGALTAIQNVVSAGINK